MRSALPFSLAALCLATSACGAPESSPAGDAPDTGTTPADTGSPDTLADGASDTEAPDTSPPLETCLPSSLWADEFTLEGALGSFCVARIYSGDRVVGRSYTWGRHGGPLMLATDGSAQLLRLVPPTTPTGLFAPEWKPRLADLPGLPLESLSAYWTPSVDELTWSTTTIEPYSDQALRIADAKSKLVATLHTRKVGGVAGRFGPDGKAGRLLVLADSLPGESGGAPQKPGIYAIHTCSDGSAGSMCSVTMALATLDGADTVDEAFAVDSEGNVFASYQYTDPAGTVFHRVDAFGGTALEKPTKKPIAMRVRGALDKAPNFLVARWARLFYPSPNADGTVHIRAQSYGPGADDTVNAAAPSDPAVRMNRVGPVRLLGDDPRYLWLETPGGRFYALKWK